ncbi:MAG: hypothetical protein ACI88H_001432 [Cocleimonas sp.]|jgi:hypothetical protein
MALPKWATEKSTVEAIETKEERVFDAVLKKTKKKEKADIELSDSINIMTPDGSGKMLETVEVQYEGNSLGYHGYTFI